MAELSKIRKNGVDYDIKDETARAAIEELKQNGAGGSTVETITETGVMVSIKADEGAEIKVEADTAEQVTLVHSGKNLIGRFMSDDLNKTHSGVHVTGNADGSITLNGTATANVYIDWALSNNTVYLPTGIYAFSSNIETAGITGYVSKQGANALGVSNSGANKRAFKLDEGCGCYGMLQINTGTVCDNVTVWLQLERGVAVDIGGEINAEQYTPYEPSTREEISTALPTTIGAFDGENIFYTTAGDVLTASTQKTASGIDVQAVNALIADALKFDPTLYGLPILYLEGDTADMTKDDSVDLAYVYGERSGTASVKWQGSSSLNYPKKNYTVKFDTAFEAVEGWGEQKKYCLKANYIDFSHSRNVCGAKLWGKIVASRNSVNENLATCPNYGAVDGFPVCMVINGEYHGVYTFNIPKDAWMANMGNGAQEAILCADLNSEADAFKAEATVGGNYTDFELEYVTNEDDAGWVQTSLNNLIRACINSDGTDLDTTIAEMLDWDSAIDYYIFTALINHYDGVVKNYLLFTYDGVKWMFSAYDMDSIFGLYPDGKLWWNAKDGMTLAHLNGRHRVFNLIYTYKKDALKARYKKLRDTVLSEDNVQHIFRNFANQIPYLMLDADNRKWPTIPSTNINNVQQALDWYRLRVARIDKEIESI